VEPSQLSKEEIRRVQTSLNQSGFNTKGVDGIWGENTRQALMSYQRQQNLAGEGQLNQQTLSALGVEVASGGNAEQNGTAATGAGAGARPGPSGSGTSEPQSGSAPTERPNPKSDQNSQ
jgi:peptidoglycan hydrolase-like protein with peptidoglycan-binding domain